MSEPGGDAAAGFGDAPVGRDALMLQRQQKDS